MSAYSALNCPVCALRTLVLFANKNKICTFAKNQVELLMRKLLLYLILPLLAACSESAKDPVISITGVYFNEDETDYVRRMGDLPALAVGDEVTVSIKLDAKGEGLNTFLAQELKEEGANSILSIEFTDLPEDDLSQDKEFTDKSKGLLGFRDGVDVAVLKVKTKIHRLTADEVVVNMYLFSKAVNCEGAKSELLLKLDKQK